MAMKLYFKNLKTGKKFEVVKLDKEKSEITLKGKHSTFVEPYDKERFQKLGYTLEREEAPENEKAA